MIQNNPYFDFSANLRIVDAFILIAIVFFALALAFNVLRPKRARNRRWLNKIRPSPTTRPSTPTPREVTFPFHDPRDNLADPNHQMEAIAHADFETVPLLNREEARLLPLLEQATRKHGNGHRLMAQTSLGELLRPKSRIQGEDSLKRAYASINSKRLDFAIIDRFGHLALAIEYQGSGHYQPKAFMRDAVKREVLRKAGVPLLEVSLDARATDLDDKIRSILAPKTDPLNR